MWARSWAARPSQIDRSISRSKNQACFRFLTPRPPPPFVALLLVVCWNDTIGLRHLRDHGRDFGRVHRPGLHDLPRGAAPGRRRPDQPQRHGGIRGLGLVVRHVPEGQGAVRWPGLRPGTGACGANTLLCGTAVYGAGFRAPPSRPTAFFFRAFVFLFVLGGLVGVVCVCAFAARPPVLRRLLPAEKISKKSFYYVVNPVGTNRKSTRIKN